MSGPMNPKRLAALRALAEESPESLRVGWCGVAELLAAHDHWVETAERRADESAEHFRAAQDRLAELAATRRQRDTLEAQVDDKHAWAERLLDVLGLCWVTAGGDPRERYSPEGVESQVDKLRLRAERAEAAEKAYRARCPVTAGDVEAAGVSASTQVSDEDVEAWERLRMKICAHQATEAGARGARHLGHALQVRPGSGARRDPAPTVSKMFGPRPKLKSEIAADDARAAHLLGVARQLSPDEIEWLKSEGYGLDDMAGGVRPSVQGGRVLRDARSS